MTKTLAAISDTHNKHRQAQVADADFFVHCGDITNIGEADVMFDFIEWARSLPHQHKIVIPGNHDLSLDPQYKFKELRKEIIGRFEDAGIHLLINTSVDIDGFTFYGFPYTPRIGRWGFMYGRNDQYEFDSLYNPPRSRNPLILVSHGPAFGTLDKNMFGESCGCELLSDRLRFNKPYLHLFGHIHESYGVYGNPCTGMISSVNVASVRSDRFGTTLINLEQDHAYLDPIYYGE